MISNDNKLHRTSRQERYKPIVEKEEPKKEPDKKNFTWGDQENLLFPNDPKIKRKEYKTKKK